jgi:hypothetical protein
MSRRMRRDGYAARTEGEEQYLQCFGVNARGKETTRKTYVNVGG